MKEDKKYVWWGLLGIGVAAFFYFLSSKNTKQAIQVPYLIPQSVPSNTDGNAQTGSSISEQQNIIGSHPNSAVGNGTIPTHVPQYTSEPGIGATTQIDVTRFNSIGLSGTAPPGQMVNPQVALQ